MRSITSSSQHTIHYRARVQEDSRTWIKSSGVSHSGRCSGWPVLVASEKRELLQICWQPEKGCPDWLKLQVRFVFSDIEAQKIWCCTRVKTNKNYLEIPSKSALVQILFFFQACNHTSEAIHWDVHWFDSIWLFTALEKIQIIWLSNHICATL